MKKVIIILLSILVISSLGYWAYLKFQKPQVEIEGVFPEKPLVFLKVVDTYQHFQDMKNSSFWKKLGNINLKTLQEQNVINVQQGQIIQLIKTQADQLSKNMLFKKFMSKESALAIYPMELDINKLAQIASALSPEAIEGTFSNIAIATRVGSDIQFAEFISSSFGIAKNKLQIEKMPYGNQNIQLILIPNVNVRIGMVRLKDLIIAGIGEQAVKKMIDVYNKERPSLKEDNHYNYIRKEFLPQADITGYFDINQFP